MGSLMIRNIASMFGAIVISVAVFASVVQAYPPTDQLGYFAASGAAQIQSGAGSVSSGLGNTDLTVTILQIVKVLMFVVGIVAVVVIIYAGLQYILATGDQAKITKAKDTIIYAVVGLVVAILAYAIVNFVVGGVTGTASGGGGSSGGVGSSPETCSDLGSQYQRWDSDSKCHNMDSICAEVSMIYDSDSGDCIARDGYVAATEPVRSACTMPEPDIMTCN